MILKFKRLLLIIILASPIVNGQEFKELFIIDMEKSLEVYETESFAKTVNPETDSLFRKVKGKSYVQNLIDEQKQAINYQANRLSAIIEYFDIDFSELDSLAIIEQKSLNNSLPFDFKKHGVIISNKISYGFEYDSETDKLEEYDYFESSNQPIINQTKQIIGNLILEGRANYLDTIARVESDMLSGPLKELIPETEFEIILFKRKSKPKFRKVYLHETFAQIINQSGN